MGWHSAEQLISNKSTRGTGLHGAFHITLGNKVPKPLQGKVLTFRPAVVEDSNLSPISWLCGYAKPDKGMMAVGENNTTREREMLVGECSEGW